jgi:DNA polymerase-1
MIFALVISLIPFLDALSQEKTIEGEISATGKYLSVKGEGGGEAKFTEYRDLEESGGLYGRVRLKYDTEKNNVLKNFIKYRGLNQTTKTFGENLIDWIAEDSRIHAEFNQDGTASGRFSSSNPNLENIQKKGEEGRILRSCFIPPKGHKFIIADYSQIELRIAAEMSNDENMLDILNDPRGDIHRLTASLMFGIPYELVTREQRDAAKTLNFGIIYGMTARTLQDRLNCEYHDAVHHMQNYRSTYPRLLEWIESKGQKSLLEGKTLSIGGRIRWLPPENGLTDKERGFYLRVGKNHPIQSTSADMTKSAIVKLYEPLLTYNSYIINCIHDELLTEAPLEHVIDVARLIKKNMIIAGEKISEKSVHNGRSRDYSTQ